MPLDKDLYKIAKDKNKELSPYQKQLAAAAAARQKYSSSKPGGRRPQDSPTDRRPAAKKKPYRPPTRPKSYTVTNKDTYKSLAEKYGFSVQDVINVPGNPDRLVAGSVIKFPTPDPYVNPAYETDALSPAAKKYYQGGGAQQRFDPEKQRAEQIRQANIDNLPTAEDIAAGFTPTPKEPILSNQDRTRLPDRTYQQNQDKPWLNPVNSAWVGLQNVLQNPVRDFGHFVSDIVTYGGGALAGAVEDQFTTDVTETPFEPTWQDQNLQRPEGWFPGPEKVQDYLNPAYDQPKDAQGNNIIDRPGIIDYPEYQGPARSDGKGYILYQGKKIRTDLFLDYVNSLERPPISWTDGVPDQEYWAERIFKMGTSKDFEAISWGIRLNDRNMFPTVITPAQLEMMDGDRDWTDYMINVLNYRWDPEAGAWIKQEETEMLSGGGGGVGGNGYGYGGYGGYGGGFGSYKEKPYWKGSQYLRGGEQTDIERERRMSEQVTGIAPIHWRI